jgi:sugar lactone lactonase YvrE
MLACAAFVVAPAAVAAPGDITTVAGNGTPGFSGDGGPATSAQLNIPYGLAVDDSGNVFVADTFNNRVRKIDGSGTITTVAGTGTAGFSGDGGPATSAELGGPTAVAVDASGNLYIADNSNHRVRRVDGSGTITTVAGNGTQGFAGDGGPATSAQLSLPNAIAVDDSGNLYIASYDYHRVRKVDGSGTITTFAGTGTPGFSGDGGPAASAELYYPEGLAVDGSGNLHIADNSCRVRKVSGSGTITTVAGNASTPGSCGFSGDGGPATSAELNQPRGLAFDGSGTLYIADYSNHRVRMVNGSGTIATVAGMGTGGFAGDGGPATSAMLSYPAGVAVDGSGNLFVADSDNKRVRMVEAAPPTYSETVNVEPVSGTVRFKTPGSDEFQTLDAGARIPVGTIIDTRQGRVRLTAARAPGEAQTQTADFHDGLFQVLQPDETPPVTELKLLGFNLSECATTTGSSVEAAARRRRARLFGSGRGRFRTRGRHGSAAVRGTDWYTEDRCDGTFFRASEGSVTVRDFTRRRTVILEAGESYLAPAVETVAAGDDFTCGVRYTATLVCWGSNAFGKATSPAGTFSTVSAGGDHACGLRTSGALACWGRNGFGQANEPAGTFRSVSAGADHACGVRTNGALACWGRDGSGQTAPPEGSFAAVSAGDFHTCGIRTNGVLACWGAGNANPPSGAFSAVDAGGFHTCAIRVNDALACWGQNGFGQANPPAGGFSAVSGGGAHTCAVRSNGAIACWGRDNFGQATPPAGPFTAVGAGSTHTCGMRANGTAACWGDSSSGQ